MSTYTTYALSGIRNKEVLLAAIASLGLQAQVYEEAKKLAGFYARDNKHSAEIVIPKSEFQKLGSYSYLDIGFNKTADGSYAIEADGHIPTLITVSTPEGDRRVKIEDAVQTAYTKVNGDRALQTVLTRTIPRLKALGKIPANATVRKQTVAGTTRVLVSY